MTERLHEDMDLPSARHTRAGGVLTQYRWHAQAREVVGDLQFLADAEGLPGYVHGGALSAIADEAMGLACWSEGHCAPGARIEMDFLRPVRAGDRAEVRARVVELQGRKLLCAAEIRVSDQVVAQGKGVFVSVPMRQPELFADWPGLQRFLA